MRIFIADDIAQNAVGSRPFRTALAVVDHLMHSLVQGRAYTPAKLVGPDLVARLPGSGPLRVE